MKQINRLVLKLAFGITMLAATAGAQATTVISNNPYDRLDVAEADHLAGWLGKGSLTLTSIFDGSLWATQHFNETGERRSVYADELNAIVSGKGPTFTVMHVTEAGTGRSGNVVGWYNPLNGVTAAGGNAGEDSYDAFIFNITTDRVLRPEFSPFYSDEQRVSNVGTTDLFLAETIGYAMYADAYADIYSDAIMHEGNGVRGLLWTPSRPATLSYSRLAINNFAVYSISVDSLAAASAVPETGTWVMMIVGFGLIGGMARRRRGSARALKPATVAASNA